MTYTYLFDRWGNWKNCCHIHQKKKLIFYFSFLLFERQKWILVHVDDSIKNKIHYFLPYWILVRRFNENFFIFPFSHLYIFQKPSNNKTDSFFYILKKTLGFKSISAECNKWLRQCNTILRTYIIFWYVIRQHCILIYYLYTFIHSKKKKIWM